MTKGEGSVAGAGGYDASFNTARATDGASAEAGIVESEFSYANHNSASARGPEAVADAGGTLESDGNANGNTATETGAGGAAVAGTTIFSYGNANDNTATEHGGGLAEAGFSGGSDGNANGNNATNTGDGIAVAGVTEDGAGNANDNSATQRGDGCAAAGVENSGNAHGNTATATGDSNAEAGVYNSGSTPLVGIDGGCDVSPIPLLASGTSEGTNSPATIKTLNFGGNATDNTASASGDSNAEAGVGNTGSCSVELVVSAGLQPPTCGNAKRQHRHRHRRQQRGSRGRQQRHPELPVFRYWVYRRQ